MLKVKVTTDIFFMQNVSRQGLEKLFKDVPDNSQVYFITASGQDLLVKENNRLRETSIEEWENFWTAAWTNLVGSVEEGREKIGGILPESYFDKVIVLNLKEETNEV